MGGFGMIHVSFSIEIADVTDNMPWLSKSLSFFINNNAVRKNPAALSTAVLTRPCPGGCLVGWQTPEVFWRSPDHDVRWEHYALQDCYTLHGACVRLEDFLGVQYDGVVYM
jgi:hypothetical protein